MLLWNLLAIVLIVLVLVEASRNNWRLPKLSSWATIAALWFFGSAALHAIG